MKIAGEGIGDMVGRARDVVKAWDVAVDALMDTKEP